MSVLLPIYNAEEFISETVESILTQTFDDFELIAIDDGSTDSSLEIIESFVDERIKIISRKNKGLTATLNEGISMAMGRYIARHDADDLSMPTRFAQQFAMLESDSSIGLLGSNFLIIDTDRTVIGRTHLFCHPHDLRLAIVLGNQFGHGAIMMRTEVVKQAGGYQELSGDPNAAVGDYDLWARIGRVHAIANLPEPLYMWRRNPAGISLTNSQVQLEQVQVIRDREFEILLALGRPPRLLRLWHLAGSELGVTRYLEKKSAVARNYAYLYARAGNVLLGYCIYAQAFLLAPWKRRNWRVLRRLLSGRMLSEAISYESI